MAITLTKNKEHELDILQALDDEKLSKDIAVLDFSETKNPIVSESFDDYLLTDHEYDDDEYESMYDPKPKSLHHVYTDKEAHSFLNGVKCVFEYNKGILPCIPIFGSIGVLLSHFWGSILFNGLLGVSIGFIFLLMHAFSLEENKPFINSTLDRLSNYQLHRLNYFMKQSPLVKSIIKEACDQRLTLRLRDFYFAEKIAMKIKDRQRSEEKKVVKQEKNQNKKREIIDVNQQYQKDVKEILRF
jgi:predicted DNA-binding protein